MLTTEKRPARGSRGMVVTNHPLASAAVARCWPAAATRSTRRSPRCSRSTVVEPMMVGIFGAGHAQIHLAGRLHTAIDGYTTAPAAARSDMYRPVSDTWPDYMEAVDRENSVGVKSVGVPGNLAAWCQMLARFGTFDLATVMAPAIRHAEHGFRVTGYLAECLTEASPDLARFPASARVFLPGGTAATPGRSAGTGRLRGDTAGDRGRGAAAALRRRARPPSRRVHGAGRRPDHARRSRRIPHGRARAGTGDVSRLRDRGLPAAHRWRHPSDPDPQRARGLRRRAPRLRHGGRHPPAGRSFQDRVRRPCRRDGRSGVRGRAGRAA